MTVSSLIVSATADAHRGVPGIADDTIMVGRKLPLKETYTPGFAMVELTEILSDEPTHGPNRVGRNPSTGVQTHDALVTSLISAWAETPEKDAAFRDGVLVGVAQRFANSAELRSISHRFWLSRVRFFPLVNNGREEIQALCEFRIIFRTYANNPGVAVQTK